MRAPVGLRSKENNHANAWVLAQLVDDCFPLMTIHFMMVASDRRDVTKNDGQWQSQHDRLHHHPKPVYYLNMKHLASLAVLLVAQVFLWTALGGYLNEQLFYGTYIRAR